MGFQYEPNLGIIFHLFHGNYIECHFRSQELHMTSILQVQFPATAATVTFIGFHDRYAPPNRFVFLLMARNCTASILKAKKKRWITFSARGSGNYHSTVVRICLWANG